MNKILISLIIIGYYVALNNSVNNNPTVPDNYDIIFTKISNNIPDNSDTQSDSGRICLGTSGKGDEVRAFIPVVWKQDTDTFKCLYTGYTGSNMSLYTSWSVDSGLTWNKYNNTIPSLTNSSSNEWRLGMGVNGMGDDTRVLLPSKPIMFNDTLRIWYSGYDGSNYRIYGAWTLDNGYTWNKYNNTIEAASNSVGTEARIPLGTSGKADEVQTLASDVKFINDTLWMLYSGYSISGNYSQMSAWSLDALTWNKLNNTIESSSDNIGTEGRIPIGNGINAGDKNWVYTFSSVVRNDTIIGWYGGSNSTNLVKLYRCYSLNHRTWYKYNNTDISVSDSICINTIPLGTTDKGDDERVYAHCVILINNKFNIYYSGYDGATLRGYLAKEN